MAARQRGSDRDCGRAVQQQGSGKEKLSVVHLPPLLGPPHPLDPLCSGAAGCCVLFSLDFFCGLITVSEAQLKLNIMCAISTVYYLLL